MTCRRALEAGLPAPVEARALWHLASQHKRRGQHDQAVEIWLELSRREPEFALQAFEQLAIHYEHRRGDLKTALAFTEAALVCLEEQRLRRTELDRFLRREKRLRKRHSAATPRPAMSFLRS